MILQKAQGVQVIVLQQLVIEQVWIFTATLEAISKTYFFLGILYTLSLYEF